VKALVIGGSGPTGPHIVEGLRKRGYQVAILNRGVHPVPMPGDVEQIVGDPHFVDPLREALGGRSFDVTVASYGRLAVTAEVLAGHTEQFIGIGGTPAYRGSFISAENWPTGNLVPMREDAPLAGPEHHKFEFLVAEAEKSTMKYHPTGTVFRYPYIYGPRQVVPMEWSIVRRVLDGRRSIIMIHGGLPLMTHLYAENAAHSVLLAVDNAKIAAGKIYNCGDDLQLDKRQFLEVAGAALGVELELISIPDVPSAYGTTMTALAEHKLLDTNLIRSELGYRDVVPPVEAFTRTLQWYRDNPLERHGEYEQRLRDVFDYEAEDKIIGLYRDFKAKVASVEVKALSKDFAKHPYAHPKKSGVGRDERGR
jgi:nucleoside-diphosphate-sugar epimerase